MNINQERQEKDLFCSKTTWGVIIFSISSLLNKFVGMEINFEQQLDMIDFIVRVGPDIGQFIIGPILTAWGARSAKKPITSILGVKIK